MNAIAKMISRWLMLATLFLTTLTLRAQEGGGDGAAEIDVNINEEGGGWYTQPWVWIVGAAVFILLLVALLRGNSRRD